MIRYIEKRYLLSHEGAVKLFLGVVYTMLQNISYVLPFAVVTLFAMDAMNYLEQGTSPTVHMVSIILLSLFVAIFMVIMARLQYDIVFTNTYTETGKARIRIAETLRRLPLSFFSHRDLSDLTATILGDVTLMEHAYSHALPQLYGTIASTTLIGVGFFFFNWKIALALFWPLPLSLLSMYLLKQRASEHYSKHYFEKRKVTDAIQEALELVLPLRAFGATDIRMDEVRHQLYKEEALKVKAEFFNVFLAGPGTSILRLGSLTGVVVSVNEYLNGNLSMAFLVPVLVAALTIYMPLDVCIANFVELVTLQEPIRRMRALYNERQPQGENIAVANHDVVFSNVSFAYGDEAVIDDVSFTAREGEVTALVGPSGSGKSTLTRLMMRFWDVTDGRISIGGCDINGIDPEALLENFSVVFQDVLLFNNTVRENIKIGRPTATDEEITAAARVAQAHDFIMALPDGYDTEIGENGARLSGGERQRISVARAILKDAPVIVLDEATASIDAENEAQFQKALSALIRHKTVIVIAHRLRTVLNADHIIVLQDGKIVEEGTAENLLAEEGLFYTLFAKQQIS